MEHSLTTGKFHQTFKKEKKEKKKAHSIHLPQYKSRNNTSQLILSGQDYSSINQTKALQEKKTREKYPSLTQRQNTEEKNIASLL